jgi:nickel transport protein
MMHLKKGFVMGLLFLYLASFPGLLWAQEPSDDSPGEVIALLKAQNRELSGDLRRIHREIAALRADLNEPGMKEVFAGIGYIVGLFGVAAFVAARRRSR